MAEKRPTLPPGVLPNIFDTNPPEMHPATVIREAYVGVDESKCSKAELAEVMARRPAPNIYVPPESTPEAHQPEHHEQSHERNAATRTTTVSVTRTTSH